jgi:hypothetical protein
VIVTRKHRFFGVARAVSGAVNPEASTPFVTAAQLDWKVSAPDEPIEAPSAAAVNGRLEVSTGVMHSWPLASRLPPTWICEALNDTVCAKAQMLNETNTKTN